MREAPTPCVNATQFEYDQGKHITWEDDRVCKPCKRLLERFAQRRLEALEFEAGGEPYCDDPEHDECTGEDDVHTRQLPNGNWVVAGGDVWLPGVYDSASTARTAGINLTWNVLSTLELSHDIVTMDAVVAVLV